FFNSLDLYLPQSPPPQPPVYFRRPSITTTTTRPFVRRPSITTTTQPRKARQVWRLEEEDDGFRFRKRKLTASW
ncbi:unnamed protein product, partial [Brassica rapa subsp. trilocularis]